MPESVDNDNVGETVIPLIRSFEVILDDLRWFSDLQPEKNRQSDGEEGYCVRVGDHLQGKH